MPTYTNKIVDGVLIACNAGDQAVLSARDAADWTGNPGEPDTVLLAARGDRVTTADRLARMAASFGMTVDEFKAEITSP